MLFAPEFAVGTLDAGLALSPGNRPVVAGDLCAAVSAAIGFSESFFISRRWLAFRPYRSSFAAMVVSEYREESWAARCRHIFTKASEVSLFTDFH